MMITSNHRFVTMHSEKGVLSRWDKYARASAMSYGRTVLEQLRELETSGLVVLLGLGGGTIGGDLLCRHGKASN